jgi:hypothetical protein
MNRDWLFGRLSLLGVAVLLLLPLGGAAFGDVGEDIAAWENFIRYYPRDPRAEQTFRAIVRAASAPEHYERNLAFADLIDIERAQYNEETGELIFIGPRLRDRDHGYVPPLLVMDDFATALRVVSEIGRDGELGVSIGTFNYDVPREERERQRREGRVNVEYIPPMIAGTHMGFVFFEADRWLKSVSLGRDNHTLEPVKVPILGYRSQPERALQYFRQQVYSGRFGTGEHDYGLNWFLPARPQVEVEGYSMRFISYRMSVEYQALTPDPEIARFAEHMTENFDAYCRQFAVFQELVRLHKLVQIAKWYLASGFPVDDILEYKPLRMPAIRTTRRLRCPVGRCVGSA